MKVLKKTVCLMLVAFGIIAFQPTAQALDNMQILLWDKNLDISTATIVGDGGSGVATFNGAVGSFNVNVTTGITYPILGSPFSPILDFNSVNVSSSTAGELLIAMSALNFNNPNNFFRFEVGGTTDGAVIFDVGFDGANGGLPGPPTFAFPTSMIFADQGFADGAFSDTLLGSALDADFTFPYGLTISALILEDAGQVTSFDANLSVVPEPGSLILLGFGVLSLLGIGRRNDG